VLLLILQRAKTFRLNFWKVSVSLRHSWFKVKKEKAVGYYLIKDQDINMAKVYRILEGPMFVAVR
jgi:hypothetical protein